MIGTLQKGNSKQLIINYLNSQTYQDEFRDTMFEMLDKYGVKMFNLCGIGDQLDVNKMIKHMVQSSSVANGSIDSNANAGGTTATTIASEFAKPHALMQSYYRIWKWLKKNRGLDVANQFVEAQISGAFYVNDMHYISYPMAYSYYSKSVIVIKYKGQILYLNLEDLFNMFSDLVEYLPDRETIDLTNVNIYVLDKDNKFVKLTHILRHKPHCGLLKFETKNGYTTIVTQDHPVILEDGTEKPASDVVIGDKMMSSNNTFNIFDNKCYDVDRLKYIIGFLIGDGYVSKPKGTHAHHQCTIVQKDLRNHKVYDYIKAEIPESLNNIHVDKKGNKESVTFGNKCWACKNAQINYGAQNKVLPKDILNWNRNEILSLIAGLIDSDGCVGNPSGVVDIRITAYSMVQQVAELLRFLGFERVKTSLISHKQRDYQYRYNYDMYRVSFTINKENEDLIKFSDKLSAHKDIVLRERGIDGRYETNEVLKIQEFEEEQEYVYDITTETGHFHCQGLIQHNCFNHSCLSIAMQGLVGIDSKNDVYPPKYLRSYFDIMEAYLLIAGNSTAGATGISNLVIVASIFLKKMLLNDYSDSHVKLVDEDACWQYFKEELTSFIYKVNQACRGGSQSLFTNVSIFDTNFLESIIPECQLVIDDEVYGTDIETAQRCQDIYIDIMLEEAKRVVHTFPVTTACISTKKDENGKNKIQDKDFLRHICDRNVETGFINIYGGDTSTLSSCCFDRNTMITVVDKNIGLNKITTFGKLEEEGYKHGDDITVVVQGEEKPATFVKLKNDREVYSVLLTNGVTFVATDNHEFPVIMNKVEVIKTLKEILSLNALCDFIFQNGTTAYIKNATKVSEDYVYCFEMKDKDNAWFYLANGLKVRNCRLRSDKSNVFFNSFGGASDSIGSMGVVCVNLPQLAFKYGSNREEFDAKLKEMVVLAQEVNYAKRCLLKSSINKGHLPLYTNGYMDLTKQFSTLGFVGLHNACEILGYDITTPEGLKLSEEILKQMESYNDEIASKYKIPTNMEGIPAENTASKLALKDRLLGLNDRYDLYANQFIPLSVKCNLLDRITLSSKMDNYCSGGSIMHVTVDGKIDADTMYDLATSIIESGVKYFAFNYEINQCKNEDCKKIFVGKHTECPSCSSTNIERYMRVVGFLTKKSDWSKVRQDEDRQYYTFGD